MTRIFVKGPRGDPVVRASMDLCLGDLPEWDAKDLKVDFYYWYYATFAMFQFDGPKGQYWNRWNEKIKEALIHKQIAIEKDCRSGSWEPVDRWVSEGGRVYMTAVGALTMEVYYRYPAATMSR
jgi:hypothetical protein